MKQQGAGRWSVALLQPRGVDLRKAMGQVKGRNGKWRRDLLQRTWNMRGGRVRLRVQAPVQFLPPDEIVGVGVCWGAQM